MNTLIFGHVFTDPASRALISGSLVLIAALATAFVSYKNQVLKNRLEESGGFVTAGVLAIYAINWFKIYSRPFSNGIFGNGAEVWYFALSFLLGLGGIIYLVDSKAWKWIKVFGVIFFIGSIAAGFMSYIIAEKIKTYATFDQIEILFNILGIITLISIISALVALILTIVRLCKFTDQVEEYSSENVFV